MRQHGVDIKRNDRSGKWHSWRTLAAYRRKRNARNEAARRARRHNARS